jgi:ubiquinone/menaquinone biosynthesis C-methylase UbiE
MQFGMVIGRCLLDDELVVRFDSRVRKLQWRMFSTYRSGGYYNLAANLGLMSGCCYDIFMKPFEWAALARARAELIGPLSGRVLEIGSGTGANFPYYRQPELVTAVEPDEQMMKRALRVRPSGLDLHSCFAEELPLSDDCVDHVVSTLVLCSVKDPYRSLHEIRRVCKPGGQLHLIEHVKGRGLAGRLHDLCTPVWSRLAHGCHLNRETMLILQETGFQLDEERVVLNFLGTPFILGRWFCDGSPVVTVVRPELSTWDDWVEQE